MAAILGGTVGTLAFGAAIGYGVSAVVEPGRSGEGLAALGAAIVAGAVGAVVGVTVALAVALRCAPARERRVTIMTVVLAGPPLCALIALAISRTTLFAELDTRHLFVVWLAVVLPGTALLGRWLATRGGRTTSSPTIASAGNGDGRR